MIIGTRESDQGIEAESNIDMHPCGVGVNGRISRATCLWHYLFRCEALDFTLLECGDDTPFRAEVNDFWLRIPEVEPEKQILCADYVGWVL